MDFINKYVQNRAKESLFFIKRNKDDNNLFKVPNYLQLNNKIKFLLLMLLIIIIYLFCSQQHSSNIPKKIAYVYFLHYHSAGGSGFIIPFYFLLFNLISLVIGSIFFFLFYFKRTKIQLILNIWILVQFLINQICILQLYDLEPKFAHTIWSFFDSLIYWNIVFLIFVPFLTILLILKIFKK